ncbi:craniofacial development protein 2-like [Nilaparvata lugens]|uniref:craniofacial development protein 2-like n=1 Tax=Nilaparvata lugens TaxID=108931 RepID=UPI000B9923EF|nr:craniofacial development protein 2-like [Nilaparvata lugens]
MARKKMKMGMDWKLASWNVRTLFRPGALNGLTDQLKKYRVDVAALQEVRWRGSHILKTKDYTILCSGNNTNTFGTAFVVHNNLLGQLIDFKDIDERMCSIRMRGRFSTITLISAHAPMEESDEDAKDAFYDRLEQLYHEAPAHDVKIILGDMNAKVGREECYRPAIGKESLHEESNDNGTRLIDFAISNRMTIASTCFPHKNIHKATWKSPDGDT